MRFHLAATRGGEIRGSRANEQQGFLSWYLHLHPAAFHHGNCEQRNAVQVLVQIALAGTEQISKIFA